MQKKIISLVFILLIFSSVTAFGIENSYLKPNSEIELLTEYVNEKRIGICAAGYEDQSIKVIITKDGKMDFYDVRKGITEFYPLLYGSGKYSIYLLESINGISYKYISKSVVTAEITNELDVYLVPFQYNDWTNNQAFMDKIDEVTKNSETQEEIVTSFYSYMVANFNYDYEKAKTVSGSYIPEISLLNSTGAGICYDYSAIFSAALRYKGIPAKMVKGNCETVNSYHAWNEVLIDGKWTVVDITSDALYAAHKVEYSFAKDSSAYTAKYVY